MSGDGNRSEPAPLAFSSTLDLLTALHPDHDVSIMAERLIPFHGRLVEYQHWGIGMRPQCYVAFIRFINQSGARVVDWSQFTHEER